MRDEIREARLGRFHNARSHETTNGSDHCHKQQRPPVTALAHTSFGNVRAGFDFLSNHSMELSTHSSTPINTVWPGAICFSRHQQVAGTPALTHLLSPAETVDKQYYP